MSRKLLSAVLALLLLVSACVFTSCGDAGKDKIGVILLGDENEGYTKAHIDGINAAISELGLSKDKVIMKYNVSDEDTLKAAQDLVGQGCKLVLSNSYGHQSHMEQAANQYKDVTFVAITGDTAAAKNITNLKNAFNFVYESRYVSGVVAGMKIKELVDAGTLTKEKLPDSFDADGNIKIGYVGAFTFAEVVSGYTAFYLGVKSVVENVVMEVTFTESWGSLELEGAAAEALIAKGCVIISQHADTSGAPAAVKKALDAGKVVYSVGYNVDMIPVAGKAVLVSATNNWAVYYKYAFNAAIKGETIATDWAKGYSENAVKITALNTESCAAGTAEKVAEVEAALKAGTLKVFDCSKFTVDGKAVTTYTGAWGMDGKEAIVKDGDVSYYAESTLRSAPYFDLRIDGIIVNEPASAN